MLDAGETVVEFDLGVLPGRKDQAEGFLHTASAPLPVMGSMKFSHKNARYASQSGVCRMGGISLKRGYIWGYLAGGVSGAWQDICICMSFLAVETLESIGQGLTGQSTAE